jgi:hypothetical protein
MIPSIVNTERNRLARNPRNAMRKASRRLILHDVTRHRRCAQGVYRDDFDSHAPPRDRSTGDTPHFRETHILISTRGS